MSTRGRRWVAAALTLVVVAGLLLAFLHAPFGRQLLLSYASETLDQSYGVSLVAGRLDYNLLTLDFELGDVSLAGTQSRDAPFLTADRVRVNLPWTAVVGQPELSFVQIDGAAFNLTQAVDGRWNLPSTPNGTSVDAGAAVTLPRIDDFELTELSVRILASNYEVTATEARVELTTSDASSGILAGPVHVGQPIALRWAEQRSTIDELDAEIAFDGDTLELRVLDIDMPEGHLSANGRVSSPFDGPTLELNYRVEAQMDRVGNWWQPDHQLSGDALATGTVSGPISAPRVTARLEASEFDWRQLSELAFGADLRLEPSVLIIDQATASSSNGTLALSGRVALDGAAGPSQVEASWQDLDTLALVRQLDSELPYAPAGLVSGSGRVTWTAWQPESIALEGEIASRLGAAGPGIIPMEGVVRIVADAGQWSAELDGLATPGIRLNGRAAGQLPGADRPLTHATVEGVATAVGSDLSRVVRTLGLSWLEGDTPSDGLHGQAGLELTVSGSVAEPTVEGRTNARLGYRGIEPITLSSTIVGERRGITLDGLTANVGENTLSGAVGFDFENQSISGSLDAVFAELATLAPALPPALAPTGHLEAQISLAGSVGAPMMQIAAVGREVTVSGRRLDLVTTDVALDGGTLRIDAFDAQLGTGQAQLRGLFTLADRTHELTATGRDLPLGPLVSAAAEDADVQGRIQFDLTSSGDFETPSGNGTARVDRLEWADRQLGSVEAALSLIEGLAEVDLLFPALNATAHGTTGLGDDTSFDVTVDVDQMEISRLFDRGADSPFEATGTTSMHLAATGDRTSIADSRMTIEVQELDSLVGATPLRLVQPGIVEYTPGTITTERLDLRLGDSRLTMAGSLSDMPSDQLNVSLVGELSDFEAIATVAGEATGRVAHVDLEGAINAEVVATGPLPEPTISAEMLVREGSMAIGDVVPATGINLDVSSDLDTVRLDLFGALWQGAQLTGTGELPLNLLQDRVPEWLRRPSSDISRARLTLTADAITADILAPFLEPESLDNIEAQAAARLEVEADGFAAENVRAALRFGQLDMTVAGIPLAQRRETTLEVADGQLHVRALDWGNDVDYLTLGGSIDLRDTPTADLTVTAELNLRTLSAFTTDVATEGDALLIANIQGSPDDPQVTGTMEVTNSGLRLSDPQLIVSELNGALFLTENRILLHELVGEANGGPLEIRGDLELVGLEPQGDIVLVGRGVAMELPAGVRTEVDTELILTLDADGLALGGDVTVLRGAYRETLTLTGGLLAALQEQESVTVIGIDEPSVLDAVQLNVRVASVDDIIVDNNYADASVGFDVRVGGTVGTPAVTGRATLAEGGQVRLGSRLYEIDTGAIDFVDPTGIEPELDIAARTRVSGRDITVTIAGVPDTLTTDFQSDPPESESDIVSLLLTGRTLEDVGTAPQAAAAEQALGLASTEFLGTAGRSVGLDTLRVEQQVEGSQIRFDASLVASETDPSTRLTIGKNLSDQVQVIASQDLIDSGQLTWILEYLPRRNVEFRFVLDDVNDKSYEFRHALSLGSPPRRVAAATTRPPAPRVSSIVFSGEGGVTLSELGERLRLSEGDRFDFYRWQQDRDDLERFYAERGYLEARVRPQRQEQPDGTIELVFEIVPGPATVLIIEGRELPDEVVASLQDAWTRSVFDTFLLEELQTLAREHLVDEGFLQAEIRTEVTELTERGERRKIITLRIDDGPRTSERRVEFRGHTRLPLRRLEFISRQPGLAGTAWTDPEPLTRALLALYQSEGMLEARVVIAPPEFDGTIARLPVTIDEGPVFTLSSVAVEGVVARSIDSVTRLVRQEAGAVYSGPSLSDARARVDRSYRQAGFNEVRVSVQSTVDTETNTVAVTFEIDEGPQQIVEEVTFVGGDRTRAGLIARALQISPGQPVDLAAWNRARRRLYDTGAFRSVDIEAEPIEPRPEASEAERQPVRANVLLEEWPLYRLRYGLQLKDEEAPFGDQTQQAFRPGVVGDLTRQNFAGRAVTLGTAFRWDADNRIIRGFARVPTFFGLPITSNVFVSQEHTTFGEQDILTVTDLSRLTLEQRLRPRPTMTVAYSYSFDRNHTFDPEPDPTDVFGSFDVTVNVARLATGIVIDTRNDLFDASQGWFHSSSFEYAPEALGSELRFAKYTAQQFHYWSARPGIVLASAVRIGVAAGFGQDLILSERFFAGGGNTVRGYRQDALGPLFIGQPDGGNSSVVLNQEVRFPIAGPVRGVGFLDAGNVFPLVEDFTLSNLKVGVGVGLRFDTPFGLFRLDFAAPLSDVEDDLKSYFFFSIGQVF